ncbi:MAG: hypothetical protein ACR2LM_09885 [Pyrinomonadaceae bacterium]
MRFLPRPTTSLSHLARSGCLISIFLALVLSSRDASATSSAEDFDKGPSSIVCREDIPSARRDQLAKKLGKITGLPGLEVDQSGALRLGTKAPVEGSRKARELLTQVMRQSIVVVLEDASRSFDVAFMRVLPGAWKIALTARLLLWCKLILRTSTR